MIPEDIAAWVAGAAPRMTLQALRSACVGRFGADRAPSRSVLHRFLQRNGIASAGRAPSWTEDAEAMAWLRAAGGKPLTDLQREMAQRFRADRARSRSAIHRALVAAHQDTGAYRRRGIGFDAEIRRWLAERKGTDTLDGLVAECVETFGAHRAPSRSAVHRFLRKAAL